jgi:hypothetical protein
MLSRSHENRWAARLRGSEQESDNQGEIALTANIGEGTPAAQ